MISLNDISLMRGDQLLLERVNVAIHSGQKIGVIGRNGSGKTSLFKFLMGQIAQEEGELKMPASLRKAQMQQETAGSERSAVDYALDGDKELRQIEQQIAQVEEQDDGHKLGHLHGELERIDGYSARNRAEQLLSGLGFSTADFAKPVKDFSGGWRIRLNLVQTLMTPADLLLLDEPTNHLDLEATLWLEQWLKRYQGTLLIVSHDRSFLDSVVNHIVGFEQKKLILYRGNYSSHEKQRAERLAQQQAMVVKQQRRKKEIEDFVRRFRVKATKARQAQSRLKELSRMQEIAPAHIDSPFRFEFLPPAKLPDILFTLSDLSIGYDKPLLAKLNLSIGCDSRIGLLGANGMGKSTLLKVLAQEMAPLAGACYPAEHIKIGYCAQHQIDVLDKHASPLQLLQALDSSVREQKLRDFLGGFAFHGDRIAEPIEHFSGGEKARLALALVVWQRPNILLLDEPTNHLDLEMRHALTVALQGFQGAVVVVSHDRHLLSNSVDQFLLIRDERLQEFDGDLVDYERWLLEFAKSAGKDKTQPNKQEASVGSEKVDKVDKKELRQQAAAKREKLLPLTKKLKKIEKELEALGRKVAEFEEVLSEPMIYDDANKDKLKGILQEQGSAKALMEETEHHWLELSEEIELLKQ